jgi:cytidine deaminase
MSENTKINSKQTKLLQKAMESMQNSYVVWGFNVGAAVLAEDGKIYEGCNVESKISGLGTCAERCAIDHAILHGNRTIKEIAIAISKEHTKNPNPCGACLQYIYDFSNGKANVIVANIENNKILHESIKVRKITEMLPFPFGT